MSPLLVVSIAFSAAYFIMLLYFIAGWLRLKQAESSGKLPFVSIVIPARNEAENIKACLESVFKQNYPQELFEVILIDDYSTDPTLRLARGFERHNLLVLDLQQYLGQPGEYVPNKKKAIALGIKNAKGDLIITTDGDCVMGENWLRSMAGFYAAHDYKLITGPVMIKPAKGPFAWFQQLDVINMLGITGATIRNGFPTMCNGANLMYSKKVFHEVEGFKGNHDVPTGDDIFLMHKINKRVPGSVAFVKNFDACVFTKPERGIGAFISQRVRWVSKAMHFGDYKVTLVLLFAYLFNALVIVVAAAAFKPVKMAWLPIAVAGGAKLLADFIFNIPVTLFFRKIILLLLLPLIEIFHLFYVVFTGIAGLMGRYRWKDRLIR